MKKIFFTAAVFLLLPSFKADAATLYFSPERADYNIGDIFTVDVKLDLENGEGCINTVQGVIGFDNTYLAATDFGTGDSFLSLWLEQPKSSDMDDINYQKRLKFTGGIPGGYCGRIPGDAGDSNIVGKIVFKVVNSGSDGAAVTKTKLFFYPDTQILMNDGFGTQANVKYNEAEFGISKINSGNLEEWEKLKTADNVPPEPFTLQLLQNPGIYDGKFYLVWNTTDKQTGIDHYEVAEIPEKEPNTWKSFFKNMFSGKKAGEEWVRAQQPYTIKDQKLRSLIRVKAVDKAGNSQISEYFPDNFEQPQAGSGRKILAGVVLLIIAMGAVYVMRARPKQKI